MAARDASPTSTSSTLSNITVQTEKQADARIMSSASPSSSTPPTSLDEEASVLSDTTKQELNSDVFSGPVMAAAPEAEAQGTPQPTPEAQSSEGRRSARSSRKSVATYNVQILAGTAIHTPTKYLEKHHKSVLHGDLEAIAPREAPASAKKKTHKLKSASSQAEDAVEEQLAAEAAQAARRRTSSRVTDLRKEALRNLSGVGDLVTSTLSGGKKIFQSTLRRSASDSNLKSARSSSVTNSNKRPHTATDDEQNSDVESKKSYFQPKTKTWLKQGLYVGQNRDFDARLSESQNRARKRGKKPKTDPILPLPMFASERLLNEDPRRVYKDFKLPFDTYNPLPRKIKVDGWVKLNKNRFIGDASALWKRDKQDSSQCYCEVEDGCGEACHNRIMAYECDDTNCPLTAEQCNNRPFAQLKKRAKGNRYDYGVEVMDTEDRGFGVRAMRTFQPHQIIVEYAGEIITQQECERRMKQVYKKDKCYYLMSFDNKMIIDATRGTIARFVNHSCEPNCEMIKWTVSGEPRMALFAGARGVMTGEELTYDYNFDPFSQKNIQECRCGTASCRGVLGPKPKKPVEDRSITSTIISGTKRKLKDLWGSSKIKSEDNPASPKKRKMYAGTSATSKAKNASTASLVALERAQREAEEHSRQVASREDRALKRSIPGASNRRSRTLNQRGRLPVVKSTRVTTVSFKRKLPKAGALRAVNRKQVKQKQPLSKRNKESKIDARPATPVRNDTDSAMEEDDDDSPNITPASLRSASKKAQLLSPDTEDDFYHDVPGSRASKALTARTYSSGKGKLPQRVAKPTAKSMDKTGAGIKKTYLSITGKNRKMGGR